MYTKTIFETPDEFFEACNPNQTEDDSTPSMPLSVYVVFDGESDPFLSGDGAERFDLSANITQSEMIEAAFCISHSRVHIT